MLFLNRSALSKATLLPSGKRALTLLLAAHMLFLSLVSTGTENVRASEPTPGTVAGSNALSAASAVSASETSLTQMYTETACGGIVLVDTLGVHTDTDINSPLYWEVRRNDYLLVIDTTSDGCWYRILYQGHTGYVDESGVKLVKTLSVEEDPETAESSADYNFLAAGSASVRKTTKLLSSSEDAAAGNYNRVSLCADSQGTPYSEENVPEGTSPEDYSFPGGTPLTVVGVEGRWLKVAAKKRLGTVTGYIYSSQVEFTAIDGYEDYSDTQAAEIKYYRDWADICWNFFKEKGLSDEAVAGIMGSLWAESGFCPYNLQNRYEASLNMTDAEYTYAVDDGSYSLEQFKNDRAGYGLCQWTSVSRKERLYQYAKYRRRSIGDMTVQLEFIWRELNGIYNSAYTSVLSGLRHSMTVKDASDLFMIDYEGAAFYTSYTLKKRLSISMRFYEDYRTDFLQTEADETEGTDGSESYPETERNAGDNGTSGVFEGFVSPASECANYMK